MGAPDVAAVPQLEREPPPEERGEEVEEEKEEEGFNGSPELPPLSAPPPPLPEPLTLRATTFLTPSSSGPPAS